MLLLLLVPLVATQETVLLTGGFNGFEGTRDGCELLDSSCFIPALAWSPTTNSSGRSDHVTVRTEDGLLLTCGGEAPDGTDDLSCFSLDLALGSWVPHSMLDRPG